jgi:hypothetical protein
MSDISQVDYSIYKRKDGDIGLTPYEKEVVLLPKGNMVYARKKVLNFEGKITKKISIALSSDLSDKIKNLEALLYDQYLDLFVDEGEEYPASYSNVKEWQKVDWFNVKVSDDIKVYEKQGKKLVETTYAEMPEDVDVFPVLVVSSAWLLPIKEKATFGVSFKVAQLFFRKNESASKKIKTEHSPIALAAFM